ncbi:MAG: gamma-glutamyltransferase [Cryomorphaceae bacterium]|nr:MAG: gamma-glutamyltransferase [Cryomorphaceae bacterium]
MRLTRALLVCSALFWLACESHLQPENHVQSGAVSTAHPLATEVGIDILRKGGNAFDAAVAAHYALAVVYPVAGNIGGGGFAVFSTEQGEMRALDFRETAPAAAHRNAFLDSSGILMEGASLLGHRAVGVPGSVAGMELLHNEYGVLPFKEVIQPAIDLAREGFLLTPFGADRLNRAHDDIALANNHHPWLVRDTSWREGERIYFSDLATVLERIRELGQADFYEGETANLMVREMQNGGGWMTHEDLKNYRPVWREPVSFRYRNHDVYSMPPPSSGGIALAQLLMGGLHFPWDSLGPHSAMSIHLKSELARRVYADRATHLGDPDFYPVPVDMLLDSLYLNERMRSINPERATPSSDIKEGEVMRIESFETTHLSVIDNRGNAVAITTTLNSYFGSKVVVEGGGFFLNNEMDDFSIQPGVPNQFGLVGGDANAIEPGKRMLSSMSPTIVTKNGKVRWVLGTPGGSTIITNVYQVLQNLIDHGMDLQSAVNAPKMHAQWLPDEIILERRLADSALIRELEKTGHQVRIIQQIGRFNAVGVKPNGKFEAAADTSRTGDATGVVFRSEHGY